MVRPSSVLGPMSDERIAERRKLYATVDADEKLDRMLQDIMGGVEKQWSPAITNDDDAALWDRMAAEIAQRRRDGGPIVTFGLSAREDV